MDQYWKRLYIYGNADRPTRDEWKLPAEAAYAEMQRARRAVQLVDTDKERGTNRWYMLLKVRLEPLVNTAENQRAYRAVIHYKRLRRQTFTIEVINSLSREFGAEVREESEERQAFMANMLEEEKKKADAVEAELKAQYDEWRRQQGAEKATMELEPDE